MSKVFAVGTVTKRPPKEQEGETMSKELRNAVQLYLDGEIEQFWWRKDKQGVVFLLDVATADEAQATLAKLPLVEADLLTFDYFPVGPFAPLASLIGRE